MPETYRQREVQAVIDAQHSGECFLILGLSGSGKSNFLGFLAHRAGAKGSSCPMLLIDANRISAATPEAFFEVLGHALHTAPSLESIETALRERLAAPPQRLSLLIDRFEALPPSLYGALRALRDTFKYQLTYTLASRQPLAPDTELAELFFAHTLWLGPLTEADALWSIRSYQTRARQEWDAGTQNRLAALSGRYPSLLRAVCQAHAAGCPLETETLRRHLAVRRRLDEFWAAQPSAADLRLSGLEDNLLLVPPAPQAASASRIEELTAKEALLYAYFCAHPGVICEKDELIQAVWPEDQVLCEGIRDDSLSQLVRRLRRKIEPNPADPCHILNVPGRGYRFQE